MSWLILNVDSIIVFHTVPIQTAKTDHPWTAFVQRERIQSLANVLPIPPPPPPGIILLINLSHNPASSLLIAPSEQCTSLHFPSTAKKIESSHQLSQDILIERVNLCNSSSVFLGSPFSGSARSFQILPGLLAKLKPGVEENSPRPQFPSVTKDCGGLSNQLPNFKTGPNGLQAPSPPLFPHSQPRIQFAYFFFFLK